MSNPTPYQTADAALMQALADLASTDLTELFLPNNWQLLRIMLPPDKSGVQGYFAKGLLPSTGKTVAVLALGISWTDFMNWYSNDLHQQVSVPSKIVGGGTTSPLGAELEQRSYSLQETLGGLRRRRQYSLEQMKRLPALAAREHQHVSRTVAALQPDIESLTEAAAKACANDEEASARVAGFESAASALLESLNQYVGALERLKGSLSESGQTEDDKSPVLSNSLTAQRKFFADYPAVAAAFHQELNQLRSQSVALVDASAGTANAGNFDLGYILLYNKLQSAIWANITYTSGLPLYVIGQTQASPLAQLAALDLRPGRTSPTSPVTSLVGYTFSTPAMGDQPFSAFYNANVTSYSVWANTVDFFPTTPTVGEGYYPAGQAQNLKARVPPYDAPWFERDGIFYQGLLGGNQTPHLQSVSAMQHPLSAADSDKASLKAAVARLSAASSYSQDLAYTLSVLCAVAYQRFQHPDLPPPIPATWSLFRDFSGATMFGSIFYSPDSVAVVFRGTVSWEELITIQGDFSQVVPAYLPANSGQVSEGISGLYQSLRTDLQTKLKQVPGLSNLRLIITGHSVGGALATLCAIDLNAPQPGIQAPALLYTFGAPAVGDIDFATYFNNQMGSNSYNVARPFDIVPKLALLGRGAYTQVNQSVQLPGKSDDDGYTYHPINTYIELLDPQT